MPAIRSSRPGAVTAAARKVRAAGLAGLPTLVWLAGTAALGLRQCRCPGTDVPRWFRGPTALALVMLIAGASALGSPMTRAAVPYARGDVFASVGHGQVKHFSPTGALLETLDTTTGSQFTTGGCFDTAGNFFVTDFTTSQISK